MIRSRGMTAGFTMLEVLLALVILAIISMTTFTTYSNAFRIRDSIDRVERKAHAERTLFGKLARDLSMAFIMQEKKYNTLFFGEDLGLNDRITFSTFGNWIPADSEERSDLQIVSYYTEKNDEQPNLVDVYRWTYPFIEDDQYWGERRGIKIIEGIKSFDVQFDDGETRRPTWNTEQTEFIGKLPRAVGITLEKADGEKITDLIPLMYNTALASQAIKRASKGDAGGKPTPAGQPSEPSTNTGARMEKLSNDEPGIEYEPR